MAGLHAEKGGETILLVDSEVLVRHAIADYLRECGYTVIEAATGDEAVTAMSEAGLPIAAMLCQVEITGSLNGFALRRWAQEHRPDLQVVLAGSMTSTANAAAELCDQGPELSRPYDPQGVVEHIRRLLAKRRTES